MKYMYPCAMYIIFLFIFLTFSIYGLYIIYDSTTNFIVLRIGYIIFCTAVLIWYYENYRNNKDRYVLVEKNYIMVKNNKFTEVIYKEDIDCIIIANHRGFLKIFNVTHIFTKHNKYFYFTNDLNKYKKFKKSLKHSFGDVFIEKNKIIPSNFVVNKEKLLSY